MSRTNEKNYILYLHISPSGKKYFGITGEKKPEYRWKNGNGYKDNQHFWKAIQKYGWNNIEHIILANDLTKEDACLFEQILIALYDTTNHNNGYNNSSGGEHGRHSEETKQKISKARKGKYVGENNSFYGRTHSEETKRKLSEARKGKTLSEETKQKIREHHWDNSGENNPNYGKCGELSPRYGKIHSEETKEKISKARKGKTHSEETKEKIRKASEGRIHSEEAKEKIRKANSKTIICITTKQVFYGIAEAEKITGICRTSIGCCCRGSYKSAGKAPDGTKLKWAYVQNLPKPQVSEDKKQLLRNGPKPLKLAC